MTLTTDTITLRGPSDTIVMVPDLAAQKISVRTLGNTTVKSMTERSAVLLAKKLMRSGWLAAVKAA